MILLGMQVGELFAEIGLDQSLFDKGLKSAESKFKALGDRLRNVGKSMTVGVTLPIAGAATASFKMAADMEDAIGAADQIFKSQSKAMHSWASNLETYYGIAGGEALEYSNMMGSMLQNIGGLTEDQAAKQAQTLVELAGDLTAMYGGETSSAVQALTGALKGNNTMLDNYGMAVNDAMVKTKALEMGLTGEGKEMTLAAKQAATLALIMEQTTAAQGQAAREAEGSSGSWRSLVTEIKNLSVTIGDELLPIITPIIQKASGLVRVFKDLSPTTKKAIVTIALVVAAIGPLLLGLGMAANALTSIAGAAPTVVQAFGNIGKAGGLLGKAFSFLLANPIVLGIGLIIAAAYLLWKNWDKIGPKLAAVWQGIKDKASDIFGSIKEFFKKWGPDILVILTGPIGLLVRTIIENWDSIKRGTIRAWTSIKTFLSDTISKIKGFFNLGKEAFQWGADLLSGFWAGIKSKWDTVKTGIKSIGSGIKARLKGEDESPGYTRNEAARRMAATSLFGANASGTDFWKGGLTWVGEKGPELLNLPRGSQVLSNSKSIAMMQGTQKVIHEGTVVHEFRTMDGNLVAKVAKEFEQGSRRIPTRVTTIPSMA